MVVVVRIGLATSGSSVILLLYASRSGRHLQVGLLVAGNKTHCNLHGFVGDHVTACSVHVINALRRWKEAINPTYTYGKRLKMSL